MARLARAVLPGLPYHVTHRGNRRGELFFSDEDRCAWLHELGEAALRFRLKIWGWCLMGNPVHLLAVPGALRQATRTGRPCGSETFVKELEIRRCTGFTCYLPSSARLQAPPA